MISIANEVDISFEKGNWNDQIDVRDFIKRNSTPYYGDASFLEGATEKTKILWGVCQDAIKEEREKGGCRAIDTQTISGIASHGPGYIYQALEDIVGLQTEELLKRAIKPFAGLRIVERLWQKEGWR